MPANLPPTDDFAHRHLGPSPHDIERMLQTMGVASLDALIAEVVPSQIRTKSSLGVGPARSERDALEELRALAEENEVWRSFLGLGYFGTITPPVILRNILENPSWYTAYTPYQAEISQGRLEALLLYQTMVEDLTGLEIANASMLDEATAAAEAMTMSHRLANDVRHTYFVDARVHPHTIAVMRTRAEPLDIQIVVGDADTFAFDDKVFGALVQYPDTDGRIRDYKAFCDAAHAHKALVAVATDLLALVLLPSPGSFGADIAIGNSQRFGVPMGYGGPHAAFMATRAVDKRQIPGRIIGVSVDVHGNQAYRMALQTREQHIRREKATSNICTAQVLLAVCAGMYAVWHGPDGLRRIARRVHGLTAALAAGLTKAGHTVETDRFFDTIKVRATGDVAARARAARINLRTHDDGSFGISIDETTRPEDVADLLAVFGAARDVDLSAGPKHGPTRDDDILSHAAFRSFHSETEMLRYLHRLATRDLALDTAMIPLGSCTMKLNATTEMIPITWSGFGAIHPFAPAEQTKGYAKMFAQLEGFLAGITGFSAVSLQPNAGSQGEYAGLLVIRAYHRHKSGPDHDRDICLIPTSAHGTNPASAVMAGMHVVAVRTNESGNIDIDDLRAKAQQHSAKLAALMVTYPSTHGVFEEGIREICNIVHEHGGRVYMDGANMNAMVGIAKPAELGADVCHLNLHKTFCIPHGGGGPGMGPIGVTAELAPFLPGHPFAPHLGGPDAIGPVSAAPWGSASILPISWAYIRMMGDAGLTLATKVAILNANYVADRVKGHFEVLYSGKNGRVAHECILEARNLKPHVEVADLAKRLMDYGFHAPTMSFPVAGTLMVEPTESESKAELDRFVHAMIAIRAEVQEIQDGKADAKDNVLKGAPHTAQAVIADAWEHKYSRERAAFPTASQRLHKYWPTVGRVDDAYGDRNLMCACPPWEPQE